MDNQQIGNVKINFDYACESDGVYSEGDEAELTILDFLKNMSNLSGSEKHQRTLEFLQEEDRTFQYIYQLSPRRKNITDAFEYSEKPLKILEIGSGMGAVTEGISAKYPNGEITCVDLSARRSLANAYRNANCENITIYVGDFNKIAKHLDKFDVVVLIGVLEYAAVYTKTDNPYVDFLSNIKKLIKTDGRLFIGIENRLGIKYFSGVAEDHHGMPFIGIEGYPKSSSSLAVKTFSKSELKLLLSQVGFVKTKFYYPYPDYKCPYMIFTDNRLPDNSDVMFEGTIFGFSQIQSFNQQRALQNIKGEDFPLLSNSFLVECIIDDVTSFNNVEYVKNSDHRNPKFAIKTTIINDNGIRYVSKDALFSEGQAHLKHVAENYELLKSQYPNVKINKSVYENSHLISDYEEHDYSLADEYEEAYLKSKDDFWKVFDRHCTIAGLDNNIVPFELTPEYGEIFDDSYEFIGQDSVKYINWEATPTNILFSANIDKPIFIDYEQLFLFPIPISVIKYYFLIALSLIINDLFDVLSEEEIKLKVGTSNIKVCKRLYEDYSEYLHNLSNGKFNIFDIENLYRRPHIYITDKLNMFEQQNNAQIQKISNLEQQNDAQVQHISSLVQQNNAQIQEISNLEQRINAQVLRISNLEQQNNAQVQHITNLEQQNSAHMQDINNLEQQNYALINSSSWKITKPIRKIMDTMRGEKK